MKRKVVIAILVVVLILLSLLFWPFSSYDFSLVHSRIQALQKPYQRVAADYYLDGGSVGIEIVDRDGQKLELAIPLYDGPSDPCTYHRLFLGARYSTYSNAVEVAFTQDTKRYLADMIGRYATGVDRDCALIRLRGLPRDYVEVYGRALLSRITSK
jgi:hypothetical protein